MIKINFTKQFAKDYKSLPVKIKDKFKSLEPLFTFDIFHSGLGTKKLKGKLRNFYSFRINREYRVIFLIVDSQNLEFLTLKHRKDIYK